MPNVDFKRAFEEAAEALCQQDMPVEWRNKAVQDLTDAYIEQSGQRPDSIPLQWLANWILRDELSDPHPDKVKNTEYPILSRGQQKLRDRRERSAGDVAYFPTNTKHRLHGRKKTVGKDCI